MSSLEAVVARSLVEAGVEVVHIDAEGAVVRLPGGPEQELRFANLRRGLAVSPAEAADAVIARFVRSCLGRLERPGVGVEGRELLPHLLAPGSAGSGLGGPWIERLADGHLWLSLCLDDGDSLQLVKLLDFPKLGVSLAKAKAGALEALAARSVALVAELAARPDPLAPAELSTGDGHDAARLLLAHGWFVGAEGVLGLAPSRDLLLVVPVVGGAQGRAALRAALEWRRWAAGAVHELPYPVSPQLFWSQGGRLELVALRPAGEGRAALHLPEGLARLLGGAET